MLERLGGGSHWCVPSRPPPVPRDALEGLGDTESCACRRAMPLAMPRGTCLCCGSPAWLCRCLPVPVPPSPQPHTPLPAMAALQPRTLGHSRARNSHGAIFSLARWQGWCFPRVLLQLAGPWLTCPLGECEARWGSLGLLPSPLLVGGPWMPAWLTQPLALGEAFVSAALGCRVSLRQRRGLLGAGAAPSPSSGSA